MGKSPASASDREQKDLLDMQDVESEMKRAEHYVRKALRRKEAARNSPDFLVWYVRKYLEGDGQQTDIDNFEEFKGEIPISSMLRKRREIQNSEGKFLPTRPKAIKNRSIKAEHIEEYYGEDSEEWEKFQKHSSEE